MSANSIFELGAIEIIEQTSPWEQTTPLRSACWEIRATSGGYASYWNTYL